MANKEIFDLTAATLPLAGTETVHIVQGGNSRKTPVSSLFVGYYDIALFAAGVMTASEVILRYTVVRAFSIPATATGSKASAGTAATTATTLAIKKNGTNFATLDFAASATLGVFTQTTATSFAVGDVIQIVGPAVADAGLANLSITLKGTLV
jgi:hypothetical protein